MVSVASPGNVLLPKKGADGKTARFPDSLGLARRQANGPNLPLMSRIKPPSDIRLLIGRRNSALPPEDRLAGSSRADAIQVDRARVESDARTIRRVSSADSQMRDFENHDSHPKTRQRLEASPKQVQSVQIQKKLFAQTDDVKKNVETPASMYDTKDSLQQIPFKTSRSGHSQLAGEGTSASLRNNARSNFLNEGGCEGMIASALDSETPMMHSRHMDISPKFHQTSKPPSTNRADHISIYRVMEDKFPVSHLSINGSQIVRKHLSEEQPVKAALASFDTCTNPMKLNFNPITSPEWSGRKDSSYDHEAYELLSQARNELHDLKENWKEAVLASRSVAKMKLELAAAQESAKEVLELRNLLSQAGDDKANLTAELRKVAMQYDLISKQLRESEARCRELQESQTKMAEEHEASRNELNLLREAEAARKSEAGKRSKFSSERVRGLENQVRDLESRVSAAQVERDDLTMECEDLRSFSETLQQAAADAEQVSKRAAFNSHPLHRWSCIGV